jgi:hypothetical protein
MAHAAAQTATYTTLYSFRGGPDGFAPNGVTLAENGDLYGTTYTGGSNTCGPSTHFTCGTVFRLTPDNGGTWTKTVIFSFNGADGALPSLNWEGVPGPRPVLATNGALYGTTENGGQYDSSGALGGTVFELTPPSATGGAWTETVLYSFQNSLQAPHAPYGGLLLMPTGALAGTTFTNSFHHGSVEGGTVFELVPPTDSGGIWSENSLIDFETAGLGMWPAAGLVAFSGSLYGTLAETNGGGGCGSVYELSPPAVAGEAWEGGDIYNFGGPPSDGCEPIAPITIGPGGVLYGTTFDGGTASGCILKPHTGCGAVFQLTPPSTPGGAWGETVIHVFTGANGDGAYPASALVLGKNGVLYGTTPFGGDATSPCNFFGAIGCGIVYQLTPPATPGGAWTESILHSFTGQNGDGSIPGPLTLSSDGVLYGPAQHGGTENAGAIFAVRP